MVGGVGGAAAARGGRGAATELSSMLGGPRVHYAPMTLAAGGARRAWGARAPQSVTRLCGASRAALV